ncbi:uncharacterized protein LOC110036006 [Phalaenopsis equestris]|uniref:uncharacterized protein LOC110036006 n=1 Tax=Phalaenopsis equestris TaxID=78828 RepID=UPI0009E50C88|nr:uncharacterized protein LOC110036006 [Phalaenopsis equestris]
MCKTEEESLHHLFFKCSKVQQVWNLLLPKLKLNTIQLSWDDFNISWKDLQDQSLPPIPYIIAWFVWMARNKLKFDEAQVDATVIATNCNSYLQKLYCHRKLPEILCTTSLNCSRKFQTIYVHWSCPPKGWVKVNSDGSFISLNAGVGGVFRNARGECQPYFQSPTRAEDPLEAEAKLFIVHCSWPKSVAGIN